jgi:hypothetical protein
MGAGCSNGRALAVQDSVTKKQISITSEGREHLKNMSSQLNTSKLRIKIDGSIMMGRTYLQKF